MKRLQAVATSQVRTDLPDFRPGDTVKVHVRVIEGEKERVQIFEGVVLGIRGAGNSRTFTVRKISGGVGVERVFPLASPMLRTVEVVREGDVRRAKLFYLRDRVGKRARVRQKRLTGGRTTVVPGEEEPVRGPEEEAPAEE